MMMRRGGGGEEKRKCSEMWRRGKREGGVWWCEGKKESEGKKKKKQREGGRKKKKKSKTPPKILRVSEERGRVGAVQGVGTTRGGWPAERRVCNVSCVGAKRRVFQPSCPSVCLQRALEYLLL